MDEVRNTPPPLPTIPRPTIPRPNVYRSPASNGYHDNNVQDNEGDNDSDGSGSFRSRFTAFQRPEVSMNDVVPPAAAEPGAVNNLRQLMNRQASLTDRMLESPHQHSTGARQQQYQQHTSHFSEEHQSYDRQRSHDNRGYETRSHDISYEERSHFGAGGDLDERSVDTGFDEDPFNNNSMVSLDDHFNYTSLVFEEHCFNNRGKLVLMRIVLTTVVWLVLMRKVTTVVCLVLKMIVLQTGVGLDLMRIRFLIKF